MRIDRQAIAHPAPGTAQRGEPREIILPNRAAPNLLSWASDIEAGAIEQAARAARLPFVAGHVALMPDAHVGIGATVGSVIPAKGAIIPAAVAVDIGLVATETTLTAADLPENLAAPMPLMEKQIPAGVGQGHDDPTVDQALNELNRPHTDLSSEQEKTISCQFGALGSGNHFAEVCLDEHDRVWTVLHSGSRGIGNQLATLCLPISRPAPTSEDRGSCSSNVGEKILAPRLAPLEKF
ncbi:RtcB family protein [Streptosporangium subroseum]|uniref:RtcB family protein n=1 Tax=Streptosporangium subroseum TaxID=106412 RepID=UPI0030930013|nr:RtcB family protein [Streptosporangium subroseum]